MGISSVVGIARDDTGLIEQADPAAARPRRRRVALRLLEGLLFAAGATLLVVYAAAQVDAARGRDRALQAFAEARDELAAPGNPPAAAAAELAYPPTPDQSLWGKARIAAFGASAGAAPETPLGVLTIPSVELEAPIFEGTSELTLNRGIGRIEGTADVGAAGNLGLAAHRDGFFRVLKDVEVGDAISVQTLAGTKRYRIAELLIVEPTDVHVLAPTDAATLTLVTCYPFYFIGEAPQRYIVRGVADD